MSDEESPKKCPPPGAPTWIVTFSDLMSLLLAFFVLLFSFSEIDNRKFKRLIGSMKEAFGVQREIRVRENPKGTSIIAQNFSPGVVQPTVINQIRQTTTDDTKINARVQSTKPAKRRNLEQDLQRVRQVLSQATKEGLVQVEDGGTIIIIRLKDKGLFESGSAEISDVYRKLLVEIAATLKESPGNFAISGHTDDLPITTNRFRSNWDLSSARAVSVLEVLTVDAEMEEERFEARGYAHTRPLESNDTQEGRNENRRVEIAIEYSKRRSTPEDENETKQADDHYLWVIDRLPDYLTPARSTP
jgi:chemotaxis protein MotB